jgi:hypothetical protein
VGYVTHVSRTAVAEEDGATLSQTLGLTSGAMLISVGAVVALPSQSGNVPTTLSQTARVVWLGSGNVSQQEGTVTPSSGKAVAVDVSAGEALWITMTEYQP